MTTHAGHLVYRVVDVDTFSANPTLTWKVAVVSVQSASKKQIVLKSFFPGLYRTRFTTDALGAFFFESELQAIQHFLREQKSEIEALERHRVKAESAIAWATAQPGMKP